MTVDHSTLSSTALATLAKLMEDRQLQIWASYSRSDRFELADAIRELGRQAEVNGEAEITERYNDVAKFITGDTNA